jgi:excisionase family DNA binding protein
LSANSNGSALLSPEQVATACGLSRRAVYRAIDRGELTAFRLCSRLRIHPDDVEAWVQANQIAPSAREVRLARPVGLPAAEGLRRLLPES